MKRKKLFREKKLQSIKSVFGLKVKYKRMELGMAQESFAKKCGFHRTYIGNVERGEINISLVNIYVFAMALKCPPQDLLATISELDVQL